jgi:hypothetical protein
VVDKNTPKLIDCEVGEGLHRVEHAACAVTAMTGMRAKRR